MDGKLYATTELITFKFGPTLKEVEDKITDFDTKCLDLESIPGGRETAPSDEMERAILMLNICEPLKEHLRLNASSYGSFDHMKQAVLTYLKSKGIKVAGNDPVPMDVDNVGKGGKGPGKGNPPAVITAPGDSYHP